MELTSSLDFCGRIEAWLEKVDARCSCESDSHITSAKSNNKYCRSAGGCILKATDSSISLSSTTCPVELVNIKAIRRHATLACIMNIVMVGEDNSPQTRLSFSVISQVLSEGLYFGKAFRDVTTFGWVGKWRRGEVIVFSRAQSCPFLMIGEGRLDMK